jgi:hypothetical protein
MKKYKTVYQTRCNFLKWCHYWLEQGSLIYHTSWKPFYPKYKFVEYNTNELIEKYSYNKFIHMDKEYHAIDEDNTHLFFNKKQLFKGEWMIKSTTDDLFE